MKGHIRLGGALLVGIAVIAGGFYLRGAQKANSVGETGTVVVAENPTQRGYIEITDSDGDGIMDWEEQLGMKVVEVVEEPKSTTLGESTYVEPTTYTDKFARSFFEDYVSSKSTGAFPQTQEQFLQASISAIENNTQTVFYSRLDVNGIDDSKFAMREYGNHVSEIVGTYTVTSENEASILSRALKAGDPEILKELTPKRKAYEGLLRDTLAIPVPQSLVPEHLDLVNTYKAILTDIEAMEMAFTDPLYTLARTKRYEDDALALAHAFGNIYLKLSGAEIMYANDEPGAFLYYFES